MKAMLTPTTYTARGSHAASDPLPDGQFRAELEGGAVELKNAGQTYTFNNSEDNVILTLSGATIKSLRPQESGLTLWPVNVG